MSDRSEERRELFWKQLRQAEQDVQAWPDYVKQALITPVKIQKGTSTSQGVAGTTR